jgi:choloylglycine hydrolase
LATSFRSDAPLGASAVDHGCTSFCLENDGTCVFGTNHDNDIHEGILYVNKRDVSKTGWEKGTTGEVARWTSKYGSFTFNLVGYQLPWAGMNESGLVISTMSLEESHAPAPDDRPPLESPLWLQYQLDNSSTVEEIVASDSLVRYASLLRGCCHYLACDRTGTCATIEFLDGEMVVHLGNTLPVAALTNSIYDESVQAWHERSREELAGMEGRVSSLFRFAIAADEVTGFEPTDSESAVAHGFDTLAQASNRGTVWIIVFDSENLQVHFRTRSNSQIRTVDLNRLDFTCGTPVQMLDVHADLRGDIEDDLEAYSHEVSLVHFVNVLGELGLGNSRDQLGSLLRHMESFPCVDGGEHVAQDTLWYSWWTWLIGAAVLVVVALAVWHGARRRVERR